MMMLVFVLGTMVAFSSCSNDDDTVESIIGSWVGTVTIEGETVNVTWDLNSDGTYVAKSIGEDPNSLSGKWKDNGNGTVTITNFYDPTFSYKLSENTLSFTGHGWTGKFTRK